MIPKPTRVKSPANIKAARKPYCEYCGMWGYTESHHVTSRGAGGGDEMENLISLCTGPGTRDCHGRAQRYEIGRESLREIVRRRDGAY